jgi:predicted RNase H-like nuclease
MVNAPGENTPALTVARAGRADGGAGGRTGRVVAGVDGCRGGWIAVRLDVVTGATANVLAPDWRSLDRGLGDARVVCVDMPIGLADAGPRPCERPARARLPKGRTSSVFAPPRRYMLGLDYRTLLAEGRARNDGGLSIQAFNIMPRIAELDAALGPEDQDRVLESHPELAFHRLNGNAALPRKTEAAGHSARLRLLEAAGLSGLDALLAAHPRKHVKRDDVLDACVCALVARDALAGRAQRVPEPPTRDSRGLRMEIWF